MLNCFKLPAQISAKQFSMQIKNQQILFMLKFKKQSLRIAKNLAAFSSLYFQQHLQTNTFNESNSYFKPYYMRFCSRNSGQDPIEKQSHKYTGYSSSISSIPKSSIFVSKHFHIENEEIFKFLDSVKLEYRVRPTGQIVTKYCPFCPKPHKNRIDNLWSLNIKANSGAFICFRCGGKGSWYDFKNILVGSGKHLDMEIDTPLGIHTNNNRKPTSSIYQSPEPQLASESLAFLRFKSMLTREFPDIINYLTGRGENDRHISTETLEHYKIGIGFETFLNEEGDLTELPCIYFPMFAPKSDKNVIKAKKQFKNESSEENKEKYLDQDENFNTNPPFHSTDSVSSMIINMIAQQFSDEQVLINSEKLKEETISISDSNYVLVRNKIRAIYKRNKGFQKMDPAPGYWGLFGLNTVPPKAKTIVITEGEYDAMAVYEATGLPAISLPNGANHLPVQVLPWLEKFDRIYLWMDSDVVGQSNASNFAKKLGINRVFLVNTKRNDPSGPKDANDALRQDRLSLEKYILEAKPITQESITSFTELKSQIFSRIMKFEANMGLQSEYFKWFNKKMKGFRKGEMTILTGGTGSGKTSFLSQLSLDFAKQGIGTLWGSFEVRNEILMTNMLLQYSGVNLYKDPNKFDYHASNFERLPLYFLKLFGSHDIDKVLSNIEYAIYAYDIGHVIIDNLQFLLSGQGKGFERFDIQDDAISKLRDLATHKNVHVTLVIHPKKVDDSQDLTISSVFGSAKATQEADNILILQSRPKYRIIEIKKNRFDGDLAKVPIGFDRETKRFFELAEGELFDLHRSQLTIRDLIQRRIERNEIHGLEETKHSNILERDHDSIIKKNREALSEAKEKTNSAQEIRENDYDVLNNVLESEDRSSEKTETNNISMNSEEQIELEYLIQTDPELVAETLSKSLGNALIQNDKISNSSTSRNNHGSSNNQMDQEEIKLKLQPFNNKEGEDIYSNLYSSLRDNIAHKKSFYEDDDQEAVKENLSQFEKSGLRKINKKKVEADLYETNKKLK